MEVILAAIHKQEGDAADAAVKPAGQEQQPSTVNVNFVAHKPQTANTLLVDHEHQSRGVNRWEAHSWLTSSSC